MMPSGSAPTTTCVYVFDSEWKKLQKSFDEPLDNGLCCVLYGLWTHSSNVVVHLVISHNDEFLCAQAHQLDCVGYVAETYTHKVFKTVTTTNKISPARQHIIVDVEKTKERNALQAFGSHPDVIRSGKDPIPLEQQLTVNMLDFESPFRRELNKTSKGAIQTETENGTDLSPANYVNGDVDAKFDPNSTFIRSLKNKIKAASSNDEPIHEEIQHNSIVLRFRYYGNSWRVELKPNQGPDEYWVVIFLLKPDRSYQNICSQAFNRSQAIVQTIQKRCPCDECKGY